MIVQDISHQPINDLRLTLPHIAGLLNKTAKDGKAELAIISDVSLPRRYMRDEHCADKLIAKHGLVSGFPFISTESDAVAAKPGWGIIIYECSPKLRYAVYCHLNCHDYENDFCCYVLLRDDEKAFRAHIRQQDAKADRVLNAPILPDGMLEKIVDSTIGYLDRRANIEHYGVRIIRGILLEGDPGNGKTLVCKWLRKLCVARGIKFGQVTAGNITHWYHKGNPLFALFNSATVMFFDDFNMDLLSGEMGRDIVSALDGIEDASHRVRIFTTNQKATKDIDPAFFRPGRVDERFKFDNPNEGMRQRLVNLVWPKEINDYLNSPGRMTVFLKKSEGFSFAELEVIRKNLVFEYDVTGTWDQDGAFAKFMEYRIAPRNTVGFAAGVSPDKDKK